MHSALKQSRDREGTQFWMVLYPGCVRRRDSLNLISGHLTENFRSGRTPGLNFFSSEGTIQAQ
jgi:hypothetical protein